MPVKTNCANCGEEIFVKPYKLKKNKLGVFCSRPCASKYVAQHVPQTQSNLVKAKCAQCGKVLYLQPYRIKQAENNFCSRSCTARYELKNSRWPDGPEMETVQCAYCGIEKPIKKWEIKQREKRGQSKFFCNRQCFGMWKSANWSGENNPSWKGGWTEHGTGWDMIRNVVREEQGYKCLECGVTESQLDRQLDIHHIVPARLFKRKADAHTRPNLVGLCHGCHMKWEHS